MFFKFLYVLSWFVSVVKFLLCFIL